MSNSQTLSLKLLSRSEPDEDLFPLSPRPATRADCEGVPRPCPWVGCRHNLYLDVSDAGGIKINFPGEWPGNMPESCSLDVADQGGIRLRENGGMLNVTRERARQIELSALHKLWRAGVQITGELPRASARPAPIEDEADPEEPAEERERDIPEIVPVPVEDRRLFRCSACGIRVPARDQEGHALRHGAPCSFIQDDSKITIDYQRRSKLENAAKRRARGWPEPLPKKTEEKMPETNGDSEWINKAEAAQILGLSPGRVIANAHLGRFAFRAGANRRAPMQFKKSEVVAFKSQARPRGPKPSPSSQRANKKPRATQKKEASPVSLPMSEEFIDWVVLGHKIGALSLKEARDKILAAF